MCLLFWFAFLFFFGLFLLLTPIFVLLVARLFHVLNQLHYSPGRITNTIFSFLMCTNNFICLIYSLSQVSSTWTIQTTDERAWSLRLVLVNWFKVEIQLIITKVNNPPMTTKLSTTPKVPCLSIKLSYTLQCLSTHLIVDSFKSLTLNVSNRSC